MTDTAADTTARSLLLEQALQQAAARHQAGHLNEAEQLYRGILEVEPNHPDVNFNMGLLAMHTGQAAAGAHYFRVALEASPTEGAFWLAYIDALIHSGERDEAAQVMALGKQHGLEGRAVDDLAVRLEGRGKKQAKPAMSTRKTGPGNKKRREPDVDELNLLVLLFNQKRLPEAEVLSRGLTQRFPQHGIGWKLLGASLQEQGRSHEALIATKKAAALLPGDAETQNNLGNVWRDCGELDQAVASYRRALKINPLSAEAHNNFGLALRDGGQLDRAMASFRRALEIRPDYAMAQSNLGAALLDLGQLDEAVASLRRALEIKPDFTNAMNNLAIALTAQGKAMPALSTICRALKISEAPDSRQIFVDCARRLQLKFVGDDIRMNLVRALAEPWGRPADLAKGATYLVKFNPGIRAAIARSKAAWPQRLGAGDLYGAAGLASVAADPLLRVLLDSTPICDLELERYLTVARHALLDAALETADPGCEDAETLAFYGVLAQQCFINEYVFAWTDVEVQRANALRDSLLAALDGDLPVPALWLLAVAAYFPLHALPATERLLDRAWPEAVTAVLTLQLREPGEEQLLRNGIPRLNSAEGEVSLQVQRQYEENPYPRWIKTGPAGKSLTVEMDMRQQFPLSAFRPNGKGSDLDILIAGCGTGQQPIEMAQRYVGAKFLAVDLSLASLCYAQRKARNLGLDSIEFAQADIVKLGSIDRRFDVIASSGVLHHLADPLAGWRVLLSLLRPGGLMFLGFYSEVARRNIVRAREFIASRGYGSSAEEIRRCRQELIDANGETDFGTTLSSGDFFSTSACRDLLFHVQEHRMTLDVIQKFLDENALQFLGFMLPADVIQAYRRRFPDDPAATDLGCWQVFENENPDTFFGMYQFWVQKAG